MSLFWVPLILTCLSRLMQYQGSGLNCLKDVMMKYFTVRELQALAASTDAEAQYRLGQIEAAQGQYQKAKEWFRKAAVAGHAPSKMVLHALRKHPTVDVRVFLIVIAVTTYFQTQFPKVEIVPEFLMLVTEIESIFLSLINENVQGLWKLSTDKIMVASDFIGINCPDPLLDILDFNAEYAVVFLQLVQIKDPTASHVIFLELMFSNFFMRLVNVSNEINPN